ncbi:ATP-dependent DNA helicase pif1-like [Hydra vulgaris]|uniref:ATP-dependent DNA helicase pif1-like n=1 Tax=Hydra vulgaris TaxID=6087 RepID=A0ABM4B2Q5_HYDVU
MSKTTLEDFDLYREVVKKDLDYDGLLKYVAKSDPSGELEKSMLSTNDCAICNSVPCNSYQELCDFEACVNNQMLSLQQQKTLYLLDEGKNFFITKVLVVEKVISSKNMEVDVYNNKKMESIKQEVLILIGAIVMLVRNINVEEGLCNGTIGTVILIENNAVWGNINKKEVKCECVEEEILDCSHAVVGSRFGLPLKLAFSFTVHKAQGSTMNKAVVQFNSKAFNNSLYYVSLSRVCNINDIFIIINNIIELRKIFKSITGDSDVLEFYKK